MKRTVIRLLFAPLLTFFLLLSGCPFNGGPSYEVKFFVDGILYETVIVDDDNFLVLPADPVKEDYAFVGWFTEEDGQGVRYYTASPVSSDMSLYALFGIGYELTIMEQFYDSLTLLSTSQLHSIGLTETGEIYTWGDNEKGQLGNNSINPSTTPINISEHFSWLEEETVVSLHAELRNSFLLTSEGRVYGWGNHDDLLLGSNEYTTAQLTPIDITSNLNGNFFVGEKINELCFNGNGNHAFLITNLDNVYAWGRNKYGQLGNDSQIDVAAPVRITNQFGLQTGETIRKIIRAMGDQEIYNNAYSTSIALTNQGRLFIWGSWRSKYVQSNASLLIKSTNENQLTPRLVNSEFSFAIGETIIDVDAFAFHALALTSLGNIYSWGFSNIGALGTGGEENEERYQNTPVKLTTSLSPNDKYVQISAGYFHNLALTENNLVYAWGFNQYGEVGNNDRQQIATPLEITGQFELSANEHIVKIIARYNHSFAYTNDGNLFVWGHYRRQGHHGLDDEQKNNLDLLSPSEFVHKIYRFRIRNIVKKAGGYPIEIPNPTLAGFTFHGWFTDEQLTIPLTGNIMPNSDTTIYPKFM
jgi:alpha-tubulin suppressor-like RCC1 family protein